VRKNNATGFVGGSRTHINTRPDIDWRLYCMSTQTRKERQWKTALYRDNSTQARTPRSEGDITGSAKRPKRRGTKRTSIDVCRRLRRARCDAVQVNKRGKGNNGRRRRWRHQSNNCHTKRASNTSEISGKGVAVFGRFSGRLESAGI